MSNEAQVTPRPRRKRFVGGFMLGVGVALAVLAASGSRLVGQRVLYGVAGVAFVTAGVVQLRKRPD